MSFTRTARSDHDAAPATSPYRRTFVVGEALIALAGAAGAAQLCSGSLTPPVSDLAPLGLSSWVLPGLWLFASVAAPSSAAAWLAWRRSAHAPAAVLVASTALVTELVVQIPFVGPSVLQIVFGTAAVALATLGWRARTAGWPRADLGG
jgi:hypothetical protein